MLLALVAAFSACNKDTTTPGSTTVAASSLPVKATDYIYNNYPDAVIDYAVAYSNSNPAYIVTLNTTEELAFTQEGNYVGNGANYHHGHPGDTIPGDTTHCGGGHHGGGHHGGHGHPGGGNGHPGGGIPVDSLPAAITGYITANYSGYTIMHAETDTLCLEGAVTEVMICQSGSEPVKLFFDAGNAFIIKANRILYTDTPQAVKDYITANYAGYQICDKSEKYTMADGSLQFRVFMRMEQVRKSVRLKEDGTLVCE